MRTLSSALLLLLLPVAVSAQTTIHGTVVDAETGARIAGAVVSVTGTNTGTTTNDAGAFTLTAIGRITSVTVTSAGFSTANVPVTNAAEALRIELTPAPIKLPGIEVAAQAPTPTGATLTRADLSRGTGLRLEHAINAVPGVFMQSRTPWGGARITIRGYYPSTSGNSPNSNGLGYQVFLNDIPITDATGSTVLDDIDYATLGRVHVIEGPASSRFGSAIGGTIELSTEQATPEETGLHQQVLGGSDGLLRTSTQFETATRTSAIVLNYGHQRYDSFRPHSASSKDYVRASGDFGVGERQHLSAFFSYSRSFEELAGEIDSTDFYDQRPVSNAAYLANDAHIKVDGVIAGATDHYRFNGQFSNQTTLFASGRVSDQPFAHGFTDINQVNFGGRTEFRYDDQLGSIGVNGRLGVLVQHSNLATTGVFIVPAPPFPQILTDQRNYATALSVYTEWEFALPTGVTLTAGASLNRNVFAIRNTLANVTPGDTVRVLTRSFPFVFTPRVALTKQLARHASVYASVSSGYTPPLLSNTVANDGTVDLSLKPERAVQYEVGTRGSWLDDRFTARLALYDLENTNKLVSQTSNAVTFTTNAGKQRNQGVEVSLSYRVIDDAADAVSLLRPWVSYTYTKATFVDFKSNNNNDSTTVDYSGNAVPRVPPHTVAAGLDLETKVGVSLHGTYQYVDKVPVTFDNSTYVRSYNLLSARVGLERRVARHWELNAFAGGENLLGSTYYTFLFVGPNYNSLAQPADGGRGDGYIIPGPYDATWYGGLSLRYVF